MLAIRGQNARRADVPKDIVGRLMQRTAINQPQMTEKTVWKRRQPVEKLRIIVATAERSEVAARSRQGFILDWNDACPERSSRHECLIRLGDL